MVTMQKLAAKALNQELGGAYWLARTTLLLLHESRRIFRTDS
jgi:hypothetical protein